MELNTVTIGIEEYKDLLRKANDYELLRYGGNIVESVPYNGCSLSLRSFDDDYKNIFENDLLERLESKDKLVNKLTKRLNKYISKYGNKYIDNKSPMFKKLWFNSINCRIRYICTTKMEVWQCYLQ